MDKLTTRKVLDEYWSSRIRADMQPYDLRWLFDQMLKRHKIKMPLSPSILLRTYRRDYAFFFIHALRIIPWTYPDDPGRDQLGIIEAIRSNDRVAIRSGHKVSKSNSVVGSAYAYFCTMPQARIPMTSSSYGQVRLILWYAIKQMYRDSMLAGVDLGGELHEDPQSGLTAADGRQIFGFSTNEPERAAGISGPNMLYVVDEASGVAEKIFEAIEGNRAGGAKIVMPSNPTRVTGTFYEAFHVKRNFYKLIHIPSWHSPNCQASRIIVPGLATEAWIEEKRQEWGEDSPLFAVRVAGDFPSQSAYAVFSVDLVERSVEIGRTIRAFVPEISGSLTLGVDPAGAGDDEAVIYPVRGRVAFPARAHVGWLGPEIADQIIECVREYRRGRESVRVYIDAIGEGWRTIEALQGRYRLKCRELKIKVIPVVVSESAKNEDMYADRRTEAAFMLKEWMEEGGALCQDSKLEAELTSCEYLLKGSAYCLLPKKEEKKLLKRSPDRRDALALAVYRKSGYTMEFASSGTRDIYGGDLSGYLEP